jgi:hypothetical protein
MACGSLIATAAGAQRSDGVISSEIASAKVSDDWKRKADLASYDG